MSQQKPPSKQQQILDTVTQLRTAVVGIEGTDDRGMAGAIKEMKHDHEKMAETVSQHSEAIARLSAFHEGNEGMSRRKKLGILGTIGSIIAGVIVGVIKVFARGDHGG